MRLTKICATLGPATSTPEAIERLIAAGMDVARLNFSHGDAATHALLARHVREAASRADRPIALMQDLQGPRIRIGRFEAGTADLQAGDRVHLRTTNVARRPRGARVLPVTYAGLKDDVDRGDRILLKDGTIELIVRSRRGDSVVTEVRRGGSVHEGAGLNAPDSTLSVPALTARDRRHLRVGAEIGVDAVALSFVRDGEDIHRARRILRAAGSDALVVAKIERTAALENLDAILAASDGVIVARGDLGVECPIEMVPLLQKGIIRSAIEADTFVITATQMLESMIERPTPTRAEVSDVANAVLDGSDVVMLSGETAVGAYPDLAVAAMARIARTVERSSDIVVVPPLPTSDKDDDFVPALAHAAVRLAEKASARAFVPFTENGRAAILLSAERPPRPVFAFTSDEAVGRRLAFFRGVYAKRLPKARTQDEMFAAGLDVLVRCGRLKKRDVAVLVGGYTAAHGAPNTLKVSRV